MLTIVVASVCTETDNKFCRNLMKCVVLLLDF